MNHDCSKCPVTLESFCEKKSPGYNLDLPYRDGDHVYATDGRVWVRVPIDGYGGPLATGGGRYPNAAKMDWGDEGIEWGPVPEPQSCEACHDRRVRAYCWHALDESGYLGKGTDPNLLFPCVDCLVMIHGRMMAWNLVEPLTRFGDGLEVGVSGDDVNSAVHFRFHGGYALVAPRRQDAATDSVAAAHSLE
jgi:hypothetical protein